MLWNLKEVTGEALKNVNFVDFVARIAAYRDKKISDATDRMDNRLLQLEANYMRDRKRIIEDRNADIGKAFGEFETRQEATQRLVEHLIEKGRPVKTGKQMAAYYQHVNDAFERTAN